MDQQSNRYRSGFYIVLLVAMGIIIGMALSSKLDWVSLGKSDMAPSAQTKPVAESPSPGPAVSTRLPDEPFTDIVAAAMPAVVNISTTRTVKNEQSSPLLNDPFFRQFFGDQFQRQFDVPKERKEQSLGSGVIVDPNGTIITNNHVIEKADEIKVVLYDKREFKGKVVGTDPKTDIAVVKIDAKNLPVIPWGDSDSLKVGEYVLAIGNPFGLNQTVTMGIISAVGRAQVGIADYEDFIQTDAAINPGNSGGALINAKGELIGINTAIFSQSGGYMGIGFAVPSHMARSVMDSLVKTGKVVRGWLGVSIQDVSPDLAGQFGLKEAKGALVGEVQADSPADKAGFRVGDVIVKYDGNPVEGTGHLRNAVAQTAVGTKVRVGIIRDKRPMELEVTIGELPAELAGANPGPAQSQGEAVLSGVEVANLTPEMADRLQIPRSSQGVVITGLEPDSPAQKGGLQTGDLILAVNQVPTRNVTEFKKATSRIKEGESVLLLISRQGRKVFLVIKP
jgi:serine protease Do